MEFKLEVKKYQERVAELESTVERLRHELRLLREAKSDAGSQTLSDNEAVAVTDLTEDNIHAPSTWQHDEV